MSKSIYKKFKMFMADRDIRALVTTLIGSVIFSFSVVWLLEFGDFYAGGITGLSQLFADLIGMAIGKTLTVGMFVFLLNIPLLILGWKNISRKFAYLTIVSIITQTVIITVLQLIEIKYDFVPLRFLLDEVITDVQIGADGSIILIKDLVLSPGNRLLLALIGGGVAGIGVALCLSGGGSSGGMDVIANSLYVKRNISFTKYQLIVDSCIILVSGFLGLETMLFTFVRLIVYMITIKNFYTIYKTVKIEIITEKVNEIRAVLLEKFHRGLTISTCKGGFTLQEKYELKIYVSAYEVNNYITYILEIDPKAFISVIDVIDLMGNFKKRSII